ncbi:hypothetical protein AAEX28_08960 [Lentisphaerota bacterium WC36G]|nr:hypothetical protein LJT99_11810 [Lentisphaerae bacterium WC36]
MKDSFMQEYPINVTDIKILNKRLRHRLRNLCAGVTMTTERIAQLAEDIHPDLSVRCHVVKEEMQRLETLTDRMDLLFEVLPMPESLSLLEVITELRAFFTQSFPFCNLILKGPQQDVTFRYGSYLQIALTELLQNVGESDSNSDLFLSWDTEEKKITFTIKNKLPRHFFDEVNLENPVPFVTNKSRHDGLGLPIAKRLAIAMNGALKFEINDNDSENIFTAKLTIPVD